MSELLNLRCNLVSCSLPAAGLLQAPTVYCWHAADGRSSRHHHCQGDASGKPRGLERVTDMGKVLGRLLHWGETKSALTLWEIPQLVWSWSEQTFIEILHLVANQQISQRTMRIRVSGAGCLFAWVWPKEWHGVFSSSLLLNYDWPLVLKTIIWRAQFSWVFLKCER